MQSEQPKQPWQQWYEAANRDEIHQAIQDLYTQLAVEIAEGGARCQASGRCCDFEAFEHRLYVTGLEIAWFVQNLQFHDGLEQSDDANANSAETSAGHASDMSSNASEGIGFALPQLTIMMPGEPSPVAVTAACVHQIDGKCSTHTIRPLGCRIFFCQEGTESWQQDLYEKYQRQLRELHDEFDLPYAYLEWRAGLSVAKRELA